MKHKVFSVFPLVLALAVAASAADVPFNYNFTATFSTGPVPTISGSIGGVFTPIIGSGTNASSLSSINLTILGVTYTVANAGVAVTNGHALAGTDFQASFLTGGTAGGVGTLA